MLLKGGGRDEGGAGGKSRFNTILQAVASSFWLSCLCIKYASVVVKGIVDPKKKKKKSLIINSLSCHSKPL